MQNIRQRILHIIKERGRATVADLADELGMAPVSVRHHLDILQGDGLIQVDGVRRRRGAGRPQHVYSLTPEAYEVFPKNYEELLHWLLSELEAHMPEREINALLFRIARHMASMFPDTSLPPNPDLVERAVAFLNERGYMATWKEDGEGMTITIANCPYAGLIEEHGRLCLLDQYLVQLLLQSEEKARLEASIRDGAHRCRLVLPIYVPAPTS